MPYDPRTPLTEHSRVEVELVFGKNGDAAKASRMFRENRPLYDSLRKAAEVYKILGPSAIGTPAPNVPYRPPVKTYTPAELAARGKHSEADVRAFFADAKKANDLFHSDRNEYEARREAGVSYGLFQARAVPYTPTKPPEPEPLLRVSDLLCDESNIPRGSTLPWNQIEKLCELKVQRDREKQEAADAKIESDRQAELAKLTTAQKLEQDAKDRRQADLDRLVELTTPKPPVVTEPGEVALQRELAAERAKQAG